jgi:hypothetical protein
MIAVVREADGWNTSTPSCGVASSAGVSGSDSGLVESARLPVCDAVSFGE